jgi:hypothetical protein
LINGALNTRGLLATATLYVNVFLFYGERIENLIIEFFEGGRPNQSRKSKEMEMELELSDLFTNKFGKDAIQVIRHCS